MIDRMDSKTIDMIESEPKNRRGRPATGKAMSAAEKQKAYRARLKEKSEMIENMSGIKSRVNDALVEEEKKLKKEMEHMATVIEQLEKKLAKLEDDNVTKNKKSGNVTGIKFVIKTRVKGKQKWEPFGSEILGQEQEYSSIDEAEEIVKACINGLKKVQSNQYRIEPSGDFIKEFK